MRRIPVDAAALGDIRFVQAEARKDREGNPVLRDGVQVQRVSLLVRPKDERPEVLDVDVVRADPVHMMENVRVRLGDLTCTPWTVEGRSGMTFRAASIDPLGGDNK